jgi:glycosyltransferase involved in cell wall biosynthesis
MLVWLLQTGEPLPVREGVRKMRTATLADTLVARGHQVVWWASTFDHLSHALIWTQDTEIQAAPGLLIKALHGGSYKRNISLRRYRVYRAIARRFRELAPGMPRPDLIVASLPDHILAYEAVAFARAHGVPVVVDLRDQWPDLFLDGISAPLRPVARAVLSSDFRKVREIVQQANGLTSMMSQILDWAYAKAPRPPGSEDRVFYLGAPRLQPRSDPVFDACRGRFVVTFIGSFGKYSNPMVVVRAAKLLPDVLFVVAGHGDHYEEIQAEAKGTDNVLLPGWLSDEQSAALLSVSSIGVLPLTQVRDAFPNKAFSYMSAGLPILASVEGDLKKLIADAEIGSSYPPNDHEALARSIRRIADDASLLNRLRANVQRLFEERFEATKVYTAFAEYLERIASRRPIG